MLTDTKIKSAKREAKPYKLAHAKGLYLEVRPSGAKVWRMRYRGPGKTNESRGRIVEHIYTIGEYFNDKRPGHISLEQAERRRDEARVLVKQGLHPIDCKREEKREKQAEAANTFEFVGREWLERCRLGTGRKRAWTPKHANHVQSDLERYVFPEIGAEPIAQLAPSGTPKILALLDKILDGGHAVTAVNVRQSISGIFAYAAQTQRAVGDPTYPLRNYISKPDVKHKTPLTKDGIAELVKKIEASGFVVTRLALKLLLYLFVRPGEIRKAEWSEFDLERAVWTIPGQKMKKREKHLIPLPTQAVELLRTLKTVTGNSRWLFPNQRRPDDCMSENALNAALRRLAYNGDFSAHGFRATASTELHELGYRTDIIEFQLSHSDREETRASYNQAQYWGERQKMMQQWADMVDAWGRGDKNVHAIRAA